MLSLMKVFNDKIDTLIERMDTGMKASSYVFISRRLFYERYSLNSIRFLTNIRVHVVGYLSRW